MTEPFTQTIEVTGSDLAVVGQLQKELAALWEHRGLPLETEGPVSLALEEVVTNVVRHSRMEGRQCEIHVKFSADPDGFEFEVSDSAPAYNPLSRSDPDVSLPLEKRRPGGLGVFLVKKLADELSYERRDGRNRLRFRKLFPA